MAMKKFGKNQSLETTKLKTANFSMKRGIVNTEADANSNIEVLQ